MTRCRRCHYPSQ